MKYSVEFVNSLISSRLDVLMDKKREIDEEISRLRNLKDVQPRTKSGSVKRPIGIRGRERFKIHLQNTFERLNKRLPSVGDKIRTTEYTSDIATVRGSVADQIRREFEKRGWISYDPMVRQAGFKGSFGEITRLVDMPESYPDHGSSTAA